MITAITQAGGELGLALAYGGGVCVAVGHVSPAHHKVHELVDGLVLRRRRTSDLDGLVSQ
nr:hypothetical protein [Enorma phocaeensis]